jgi:hypothetical protein
MSEDQRKLFDRYLKCVLTDDEKASKREQVMVLMDRWEQIDAERARAVEGYKSKLGVVKEEMNSIRHMVKMGVENRTVQCEEFRDYALGLVWVKRLDTGEIIEERAMTAEERQPKLPIHEAAAKPTEEQVKERANEIAKEALAKITGGPKAAPEVCRQCKTEFKSAVEGKLMSGVCESCRNADDEKEAALEAAQQKRKKGERQVAVDKDEPVSLESVKRGIAEKDGAEDPDEAREQQREELGEAALPPREAPAEEPKRSKKKRAS